MDIKRGIGRTGATAKAAEFNSETYMINLKYDQSGDAEAQYSKEEWEARVNLALWHDLQLEEEETNDQRW